MKRIARKLHEWAADHIGFIQYPDVRGPKLQVFRYPMPWQLRLGLIVFGSLLTIISATILAVMLYLLYSVMS